MRHIAMKKILHITPHFGGGVGSTVLSYLARVASSQHFKHTAVCLDYANKNAIEISKKAGFSLFDNMSKKKSKILKLIADADVVLIHWWNHPLLYDFLVREQLPASRIILWSLIVGSPSPNNFTDKLLKYSDMFVFSSPLSYKIKEVQKLPAKNKRYLRDIWATGTVDHIKSLKLKKHPGFNIGYMGTVDYAKMHPDFLEICSKVNIPNVKFIVVGGKNEKIMEREAKKLGIADKFNFTGFVSEAEKWKYLSTFDIFGYPLAPHHYGTCDLALQESMVMGVVPVVLANPMESYIVKSGTGIVAKDKNAYIKALEDLYYNHKRRNLLSKNTRKYALKAFSLEKMVREWDRVFNEILVFPKKVRKWEINKNINEITSKDVFLESLDNYGKDFVSYCNAKNGQEKKNAIKKIKELAKSINWQSKTKSTVHHYHSFFPNDKYLSLWSKLMRDVKFNKKDKV